MIDFQKFEILCMPRSTYLLCGVFIVVVQVLLLLLALLLLQRLTYEASHFALHPRLLPPNQKPIISKCDVIMCRNSQIR